MFIVLIDFNFEDESSSTANTQEQLLELGARIDHVSEKMYPILSMVVGMKMNGFKIFNEQVIPVTPARYDFEANKKNNLIFYGLTQAEGEVRVSHFWTEDNFTVLYKCPE